MQLLQLLGHLLITLFLIWLDLFKYFLSRYSHLSDYLLDVILTKSMHHMGFTWLFILLLVWRMCMLCTLMGCILMLIHLRLIWIIVILITFFIDVILLISSAIMGWTSHILDIIQIYKWFLCHCRKWNIFFINRDFPFIFPFFNDSINLFVFHPERHWYPLMLSIA